MINILIKKRGLLIASWIFGMSFNICLIYFEKLWYKLWPTSFLILEVAALGYGISLIITLVDIFFKEHRNMRVIFLNAFFILLTISIVWFRSHILGRTPPFKVIFNESPSPVEVRSTPNSSTSHKLIL